MIKALIVEDDAMKYGQLYNALANGGVDEISHAISAADAFRELKGRH